MTPIPGTNDAAARPDLSQTVADAYRTALALHGRQEAFETALVAVREDLEDVRRVGADAGFVLHALVSARFLREPRQAGADAVARLPLRRRRQLLGAVRTLRALGVPGLHALFGAAQEDYARTFAGALEVLHQKLAAPVVIEAPAFLLGVFPGPRTGRQRGHLLGACIVTMARELKGHPKPNETIVVLLEKFGVLDPRRGDLAAVEWVRKRLQRDQGKADDPFSAVGHVAALLRLSYANLIAHVTGAGH